MPDWHLTEPARQDLLEISEYGLREFGLKAAEAYIDTLYETFDRIAEHPESGPKRPETGPDVRHRLCASHVIYIVSLPGASKF